jgi:glycine oxidase
LPIPFDVIIAGGGVIGASIAWRLARHNLRVLLLDARAIGSEASSAAAGMLSPHGEFEDPAMLDLATASLAAYPEFVRSIEADSSLPIEFRPTNAVEILADGSTRNFKNEAIVNPAALMNALRAACLARGVCIEEQSPVTSISITSTAAQIGDHHSRLAVLAAGAWSSSIAVTIDGQPYPLPRSYPIKGHLLGYRLPPGSLPVTVRHDHTYVLQRADGFTIAGSSTEDAGFDRTIDPAIVSDLVARACALIPTLRDHEPESVWIGFRPATDFPAPHIGRVGSSHLWLAYGHYRNGILLAPATCDRICHEILAALE